MVPGFTLSQLQDKIRTLRGVMLATRDLQEAEECAVAIDRYSWLLACLLKEESVSAPAPRPRALPVHTERPLFSVTRLPVARP